ncbi:MAG: hypothetical protein KC517_09275 [Bacteroidetes bacterium]|nr:hypothetical protein [Bacteroidota bacterium]
MALVETTVDPGGTGDYTSLNAWDGAEATDLITDTDQHVCTVISTTDAADTTTLALGSDWSSSITYSLTIKAGSGEEAIKTGYSTSRARLEVDDGECITIAPFTSGHYITFEGLQMCRTYTSAGYDEAVLTDGMAAGDIVRFLKCRIKVENNTNWCVHDRDADDTLVFKGCIIGGASSSSKCLYGLEIEGTAYIYNNVIMHCDDAGILVNAAGTATIKNNCIRTDNDINNSGSVTVQYNCATDDLDTEFTETTNVQPAGGDWDTVLNDSDNGDCTALTGGAEENAGVGPTTDSDVPTTDIEGDTIAGTACDIGCDEIAAVVTGLLLVHSGMNGLGNYQFNGNQMSGGMNA